MNFCISNSITVHKHIGSRPFAYKQLACGSPQTKKFICLLNNLGIRCSLWEQLLAKTSAPTTGSNLSACEPSLQRLRRKEIARVLGHSPVIEG